MFEQDVPTTSGSRDRLAILVADPSQNEQSTLVQRLRQEGYEVLVAPSLVSAISAIRSRKIFYAVTELGFDDGNGRGVIELVTALHPYCRTVVHTALCDVATAVWAAKAGAADVLPKPMAVDFLIGILLEKDLRKSGNLAGLQCPNAVRDEHIRQVYLSSGSNISRAADRLMMHRRTLQRIMGRSPSLKEL